MPSLDRAATAAANRKNPGYRRLCKREMPHRRRIDERQESLPLDSGLIA